MTEHVILFGASGDVKSMHTDAFPLSFLGPQTIERASDIRFDNTTQTWGIWFNVGGDFVEPKHPSHKGFTGYEEARRYEVYVVNQALSRGVCPTEVHS